MRDVYIELAPDISIFVGANNSGKTSATQALHAFLSAQKDRFSLFDFSSYTWAVFDEIGSFADNEENVPQLPSISLDLWFEIVATDLPLVLPLLTSSLWQPTRVGIRVDFSAKNQEEVLAGFRAAQTQAQTKVTELKNRVENYKPWPKSLSDFLQKELRNYYDFSYYVLEENQFDDKHNEKPGYAPSRLPREPGGSKILQSLIRIDQLNAQRHLSDPTAGLSGGTGRFEDLSKRLSRFYKRNLDQKQDDHNALQALFQSEAGLNEHLAIVFKSTLDSLAQLGYPGLNNPKLTIKSALNPASILNQDAKIHYVLEDEKHTIALPDSYSGLGFKNLIYMVVEVLDLHARWEAEEENRPPLHLIFIEEPETHLHAQLQQVFIRNVLDLLKPSGDDAEILKSQVVVTTHSSHIVYERGFKPVRYFRRHIVGVDQTTAVLNLSEFYSKSIEDRDFLERYLKLTHCDLFFADAAILVEGNVERLLLPIMIEKEARSLRSACLCILEVGGAYGHKFKKLLEFLSLTTLIITDIDSVAVIQKVADEDEDEDIEFQIPAEVANQPPTRRAGRACLPNAPGAVTSNQTLMQWLPRKQTINDLLKTSENEKVEISDNFKVRVAYQNLVNVTWEGTNADICARTLEEAFGLENAEWCQSADQKHLGLKLRKLPETPEELAQGLHRRVTAKSFDKTKFALATLTQAPESWNTPVYIKDGLLWLRDQVATETTIDASAAQVIDDLAIAQEAAQ